ncbi:MAG TPA: hypothetical protein DEP35_13780 [Deltaproteobacteria bacterium]|jgi:hypothetical protein|nr:hypothetical protein [Deltaproteobacteria bacterium]
MTQSSIKGVAFQSVAEDIHRLRTEGRIRQDDLMAVLKPGDMAHLEETVVPSLWYPIDVYGRCLDLLCIVEGHGRPSYLVARGAKAAERMMAVGAYRHFLAAADRWGQRAGQAMVQLASAMYNFMIWVITHEESTGTCRIEVQQAADFPDSARHSAHGFVEVLFTRIEGAPVEVGSRRPRPDLVMYEIRRR